MGALAVGRGPSPCLLLPGPEAERAGESVRPENLLRPLRRHQPGALKGEGDLLDMSIDLLVDLRLWPAAAARGHRMGGQQQDTFQHGPEGSQSPQLGHLGQGSTWTGERGRGDKTGLELGALPDQGDEEK